MHYINMNTHTVQISISCNVYPSLKTVSILDIYIGVFEMMTQFLKLAILRYNSHSIFTDLYNSQHNQF